MHTGNLAILMPVMNTQTQTKTIVDRCVALIAATVPKNSEALINRPEQERETQKSQN